MPLQLKLQEAFLYLKDHNIYALDKGNAFIYLSAMHGSAILAQRGERRKFSANNTQTMAGLPSQRETWSIKHLCNPINKLLFN